MKKIIIFIVSIAFLTGCRKNLLDTAPYSSIASSTMWTTDNLTDLGVAGIYSALRLGIQTGGASGLELYQMDALGATGISASTDPFLLGTITPASSYFSGTWRNMYEGIQRANDAIKNIPEKSPSAQAKKSRYIAEAKFLRAYYYFRLNQLFKGVPIYTVPFTPEEATKPRSTELEVWNLVISDLTDAINEPNLPNIYNAGNSQYGHITKGAAYGLRGKVYMYLKKYDLAIADFQKVKDAGYALFSNYRTLFKTANEQCSEMMFSIQNIAVAGFGSTTQWYCAGRSWAGAGWNTYMVSPDLVDLYENADGTKFSWDAVLPGYSNMTPKERAVFFFRDNMTALEISAATTKGARMSLYLPVGNEARILRAYANRDPRLAANVITPYSTYLGVYNSADAVSTMRWPFRAQASSGGDLATDTQTFFYYLHRKFVYEGLSETPDRSFGPTDFPIMRYADVLLMWAEALNEQGLISESIAKVNEVRSRAGVAILQTQNSSAGGYVSGQLDLRERIRNERRVEFPNEGIDFFDELRWGTWKEKVFYSGNGAKQIWGELVYAYSFKGDYITTWAIPSVEIERNPNMKQNPGWVN